MVKCGYLLNTHGEFLRGHKRRPIMQSVERVQVVLAATKDVVRRAHYIPLWLHSLLMLTDIHPLCYCCNSIRIMLLARVSWCGWKGELIWHHIVLYLYQSSLCCWKMSRRAGGPRVVEGYGWCACANTISICISEGSVSISTVYGRSLVALRNELCRVKGVASLRVTIKAPYSLATSAFFLARYSEDLWSTTENGI